MKKRTKYILFGILGVVVLVVLAKLTGVVGGEERTEVDTSHVVRRILQEQVSASGQLYPIEALQIAPDVAGEVIEVYVEEGDRVQEGQALAKIRPDNFINALQRVEATLEQTRAQLHQAQAALSSAQATFASSEQAYLRSKKLYEQSIVSEADYQTAEARYLVDKQTVVSNRERVSSSRYQLRSAEASVREAKENLRLTTLRSPLNGRITRQLVKTGERVVGTQQMAGTTMFHIGDLSEMELRVNVIENDIVRIELHDSTLVNVESYLDEQIKGVVTAIATSANTKQSPEAVTEYEIKIRLLRSSYLHLIEKTGKDNPLLPGMTASVEIITEQRDHVLSVPLAAVTIERRGRRRGGEDTDDSNNDSNKSSAAKADEGEEKKKKQEIVFLYRDGKAHIQPVKTGISTTQFIEIKEGLTEEDVIISGPFLVVTRRLKDQEAVAVRASRRRGGGKR